MPHSQQQEQEAWLLSASHISSCLDYFHSPIFLIFVVAEKLLTERGNSGRDNLCLHPESAGSNTNFTLFRIFKNSTFFGKPLFHPYPAEVLGLFRFWRSYVAGRISQQQAAEGTRHGGAHNSPSPTLSPSSAAEDEENQSTEEQLGNIVESKLLQE